MKAIIHNGQTYEAVLPVKHCPSNSGCRSVVRQTNGNTQFQLTENFLLTLKVLHFLIHINIKKKVFNIEIDLIH